MAEKDEPWRGDNVSIDFIIPGSKQDKKKLRATVHQNASGTIQPFDITTYQYDSTLIESTDITTIFKAIIVFLNGGGYTDPFIGTPKQAKVLPRHSNIKPHRGSASSTTLTCSRNIGIDDNYLNEMTIYCLGDIIPLNENKQYNKNGNMKQTIKLTESELRNMITESVKRVLNEEQQKYVSMEIVKRYAQGLLKAIESNDNAQILLYGSTLQKWLGPTIAQLQQQQGMPNWMRQYMQPQQIQQMQQPPQQTGQPTNNNTMIDNQVQQQMQRNMGLQQKMANKIRQQKMAKFN